MNGISIVEPIGRLGNHIIIIMNAIYLAKKYNLQYILLDNYFSFHKLIDLSSKLDKRIKSAYESS